LKLIRQALAAFSRIKPEKAQSGARNPDGKNPPSACLRQGLPQHPAKAAGVPRRRRSTAKVRPAASCAAAPTKQLETLMEWLHRMASQIPQADGLTPAQLTGTNQAAQERAVLVV